MKNAANYGKRGVRRGGKLVKVKLKGTYVDVCGCGHIEVICPLCGENHVVTGVRFNENEVEFRLSGCKARLVVFGFNWKDIEDPNWLLEVLKRRRLEPDRRYLTHLEGG